MVYKLIYDAVKNNIQDKIEVNNENLDSEIVKAINNLNINNKSKQRVYKIIINSYYGKYKFDISRKYKLLNSTINLINKLFRRK